MGGMIPVRDASRESKRYPLVTTSLIVVNVLGFLLELARDTGTTENSMDIKKGSRKAGQSETKSPR